MDSNICVATITGLATSRQRSTRRFWMGGTFCTGSSTPKSPRATMIPSETFRISSKCCTAEGFSIFDRIAARPSASSRASIKSCGLCTKDSASQSTPRLQTNSRSVLSFSDSAASGSTTSGTLTPLRSEIIPPAITVHWANSGPQLSTRSLIFPSLINRCAPALRAAKISGCGN